MIEKIELISGLSFKTIILSMENLFKMSGINTDLISIVNKIKLLDCDQERYKSISFGIFWYANLAV